MRRLVFGFVLILFICLAGGLSILFVMRDQLLLREARLQAEKLSPLQVEIGSLHTRLLGAFAVELGNVELRQRPGLSVKVHELRVDSALGLAGLFRAWRAKEELPLNVTVTGLKVHEAAASPAPAAKPAPWPRTLPLPAASPVPLRLTLTLKGGEVSGPATLKELQAKIGARLRESGMEATISATASAGLGGGEALLPVSVDAKVAASASAVKLQSLGFKVAGLEGSGGGELALSPVKGHGAIRLLAPDLSKVSLSAEERAAAGLTAQPAGAVALDVSADADENGVVSAGGTLRLTSLVLPLRAPEKTAFSALAAGNHIDGPVSLNAEVPFTARLAWPPGSAPPAIAVQKGHFAFDVTQAALSSTGKLEKPRGIPLRGELTVSSNGQGVELPAFHLTFHTLELSGAGSYSGSAVAGAFRLGISSLAGFPALVPMLRQEGGKADAQGSVQAEGSLRLDPAKPASALVDLRSLNVRGLRLPLAYAGEAVALRGVVTGTAGGTGKYDAGDVNVTRSSGSFDLTALDIAVPGKFAKKSGKKLVVAFDAAGSPKKLVVKKASVAADGLSASLAGSAAFDPKRNAALNLTLNARAELAALREYLPKLPAKISSGSFDATARVGGTWMPAAGIEKSPLALSGKLSAKLGSVVMPEPPKTDTPAAKAAPPGALLPDWPAARNASFQFQGVVAQFQRGALTASGIAFSGALNHGAFTANTSVGKVFGGKASLKNLSGNLLNPKLAVRGAAGVEGLDLSQAAAFVDPSYGKIVKGTLKADSTFAVPDALGDHVLEQTAASGTAQIHNGYVSTASFDGLVNEKLKGIPGLGDKAKISTGGLAAEIRTAFQVAGGVATLRDFNAVTPNKDEMRLAGSMNLAFDCDLSGEAHLANAPVSGSVREANSDPEGRLVVPVRFHGNLKSPQVDVATNAIQAMLQKTASHELDKKKNELLNGAKKKAQQGLQDAAGGLLDQLKKGIGQ